MADIGMITPIRAESFEQMIFDAGMMLKNFNYASATDAATLAQLIETAKEEGTSLMGATKGGVNIQIVPSFWNVEADGMRMPFVGSKRPDTAEVKITGTLVEYTPDNVKDVLGVADKTGEGAKITVQPRFSIKQGDYIPSLVWVGNHGSDGIVLMELKNALCTTGLNTQTTDKDVGTLPFEFVGHADDVSSTELPIKILFFGAAA